MRSDIGGMMGPGWMMFGMGLSVFLGLGFLVLIALGIIAGIHWLMHGSVGSASADRSERALERLRERYARGEVSREAVQRTPDDLTAGAGARR